MDERQHIYRQTEAEFAFAIRWKPRAWTRSSSWRLGD